MSAIDAYLSNLERRLLVRHRARCEILEEMRTHLEALEAERGSPFATESAVAGAFGQSSALALRINASVPWTEARLPLAMLSAGPAAMLLSALLVASAFYLISITRLLNAHGVIAPVTLAALMAGGCLAFNIGPLVAMNMGLRLGARASHRRIAIMLPSVLLFVATPMRWLIAQDALSPHLRLRETLEAATFLIISALIAHASTTAAPPTRLLRCVLVLVCIASGLSLAALSGLPNDAMKFAPTLGDALAALVVAVLLPRLARSAHPAPALA